MRSQFSIFMKIHESGAHMLWAQPIGIYTSDVCTILRMYGHSISELIYLKKEVQKKLESKSYGEIGLNDWGFSINSETCKFKSDGTKRHTSVPTNIVIRFIDRSIDFLNKYEAGKIPGLIPPNLRSE